MSKTVIGAFEKLWRRAGVMTKDATAHDIAEYFYKQGRKDLLAEQKRRAQLAAERKQTAPAVDSLSTRFDRLAAELSRLGHQLFALHFDGPDGYFVDVSRPRAIGQMRLAVAPDLLAAGADMRHAANEIAKALDR